MDDNFILMVSKGKGLYPDLNVRGTSSSIQDDSAIYESIKGRLIIPENKERFLDEVRNIYNIIQEEFYEKYGEIIVPSTSTLSDFIDDENDTIISLLLGEDTSVVNNILTIYVSRVSQTLIYDVEESLDAMGLPYRRDEYQNNVIKPKRRTPYFDEYQLIMFGDELYE